MTIDNLLSLLTSGLVLILVGIFLAPIIRDWSSRKERQESHTPLEDLVKRRERWIQVQGLVDGGQVEAWKKRFPGEKPLIEGFLTWGDTKLLDQVNEALETKFTADDLRARFNNPPPSGDKITLTQALILSPLAEEAPAKKSDKNDQLDS